jgi:hypothetical protein
VGNIPVAWSDLVLHGKEPHMQSKSTRTSVLKTFVLASAGIIMLALGYWVGRWLTAIT